MCIIIVKERGLAIPNRKVLEHCFKRHKDGAGFMWVGKDDKVHIRKGFMTFEAFENGFGKEALTQDDALVIHFRTGTSGGIRPETCHPFPLANDESYLLATRVACHFGVAHNGVLGKGSEYLSDSQIFIRDVLADPAVKGNLASSVIRMMIQKIVGSSRIVILTGKGEFIRFGHWIEEGGLFFSNGSFHETNYQSMLRVSVGRSWDRGQMGEPFGLFEHEEVARDIQYTFRCKVCGHDKYAIATNGYLVCSGCGKIHSPELFPIEPQE
jgi:hypothetical protein